MFGHLKSKALLFFGGGGGSDGIGGVRQELLLLIKNNSYRSQSEMHASRANYDELYNRQ